MESLTQWLPILPERPGQRLAFVQRLIHEQKGIARLTIDRLQEVRAGEDAHPVLVEAYEFDMRRAHEDLHLLREERNDTRHKLGMNRKGERGESSPRECGHRL